ncbi:sensor histidine kinase [Streptomyces caatingaensis]|uniref:histidine kinase n=1 Tax=Streptomyces caatingaensis TaxID=1678637 RepID=A0A0K9XJV4_9ACTN|nr:sensor histidine kinase [Streptomyces caatingaensis]KNB52947.1 histidine kinase [Streptomyces caatingaensis]
MLPALHAPLALLRDLFTPAGPPEPLLGQAERPIVRRLPRLLSLLLVAIFLPVTATILPNQYGVQSDLAVALAVAQSGPLLLAVRRPLLAWGIAFPADVVGALCMPSDFGGTAAGVWPWPAPQILGLLVLMLLVGLRERPRTVAAVWLLVSGTGYALTAAERGRDNGAWLVVVILGGLLMALGSALRRSSTDRRALAEQETISEAERARRTLLEERTRIARELHDVVAHHMSVITVQADSAPYRLPDLPPAAAEEFGTIAATARESLAEMRRLLGVLRSEDAGEGGGEKTPQPGVDRIGQLVEATVRAGQPVELTLDQDLASAALPQAVDLSAYRIVQEALANVVRHAPGALARVSVSADDEGLTVLVVNDPADGPHTPLETAGTGHGLVGMRERVRLVGGTLDTGPLPGGGFRVAARLPFVSAHLEKENPAA